MPVPASKRANRSNSKPKRMIPSHHKTLHTALLQINELIVLIQPTHMRILFITSEIYGTGQTMMTNKSPRCDEMPQKLTVHAPEVIYKKL